MGYKLVTEATDEPLKLSSREWEMLRRLAAEPPGWEPEEGRDYIGGTISAEEALKMAESVEGQLPYLSRERDDEQLGKARTREELSRSLGYEEGNPRTFFGDDARRRKVESFIRLASEGAFEVIWVSDLEPDE